MSRKVPTIRELLERYKSLTLREPQQPEPMPERDEHLYDTMATPPIPEGVELTSEGYYRYTDKETGITISASGEKGAEFVAGYIRIAAAQEQKNQAWITMLRKNGIKAAHPDDGWVDRDENLIWFQYPQFDDNCGSRDQVALGWPDRYRIVILLEEVPIQYSLSGRKEKRFRFEEVPFK